MSDPTVLETCTTDELWDELSKRFDACVLIAEQKGAKGSGQSIVHRRFGRQHYSHSYGLVCHAKRRFDVAIDTNMETDDGECDIDS